MSFPSLSPSQPYRNSCSGHAPCQLSLNHTSLLAHPKAITAIKVLTLPICLSRLSKLPFREAGKSGFGAPPNHLDHCAVAKSLAIHPELQSAEVALLCCALLRYQSRCSLVAPIKSPKSSPLSKHNTPASPPPIQEEPSVWAGSRA